MQWIKAFGILTIVCGCIDIGFARIINTDSFNQLRTSQSITIPPGYILFQTSYYKYYNNSQTWEAAQETCEKDGGHLVIINSEDEAFLLRILMNLNPSGFVSCLHGYIHIGLKKRKNTQQEDDEEEWITIDGQSLKHSGYDKWAPGEPNKWGNMEDCGTFSRSGGLNDFPCWCNNPFVCEIPLKKRTDQLSQNSDFHDWVEVDGDYNSNEYEYAELQKESEKNKYFYRVLSSAKTSTKIQEESEKYEHIGEVNDNENIADSFTDTSTEAPEEMEEYEYKGEDLAESITEAPAKTTEELNNTYYFDEDLEDSFTETFTEAPEEMEEYEYKGGDLGESITEAPAKTTEELNNTNYFGEDLEDSFTETFTEAPEEMEEYEYKGGDLGESITEAPAKTTEELNNTNYFGEDLEDSFTETFTEAQEEPENIKSLEQSLRDWSIIEDVVAETTTEHQKEPQEKKNWITMVGDNLILYFPTESSSIKIFDVNKDFRGLSISCKNCSYMMSFNN